MINSHSTRWQNKQATQCKLSEEDVGLSGLDLHSNSSDCLVLTLYKQLGKYSPTTRESSGPTVQHICKTLNKSVFDIY